MITPKKLTKVERNEYISPRQYAIFRSKIDQKDLPFKLCFDIMYFLGLRPVEIAHIQVKDIDLKDKVLHYITAKNNQLTYKAIPEPLFSDLKGYLERNLHRFREGFIFIGYGGKPYETNTISKKFRYYCAKCNLVKIHRIDTNIHLPNAGRKIYTYRLYSLRHSYATNIDLNTNNQFQTCQIMRHTNPKTTYRYVDHNIKKIERDIQDKISNQVTLNGNASLKDFMSA